MANWAVANPITIFRKTKQDYLLFYRHVSCRSWGEDEEKDIKEEEIKKNNTSIIRNYCILGTLGFVVW
jgi:hypothetical protein